MIIALNTKMIYAYDDNMIINDCLLDLIQCRYAIVDMNYDEPNDTYTIELTRPDDINTNENSTYKTYIATITTHIDDENPDDLLYSHEMTITITD